MRGAIFPYVDEVPPLATLRDRLGTLPATPCKRRRSHRRGGPAARRADEFHQRPGAEVRGVALAAERAGTDGSASAVPAAAEAVRRRARSG